jgi:AraC-like DNA-binding protein
MVWDLLLRGGAAALLMAVAALLWRDYRHSLAARLGAGFAAASAGYAIFAAPALYAALAFFSAPLLAVFSANGFVFWLFSRSLFRDDFCPSKIWGFVWSAIVGMGLVLASLDLTGAANAMLLRHILAAQSLVFTSFAIIEAVAGHAADLIEHRRHLRVFVIAAALAQSLLTALPLVLARHVTPPQAVGSASLAEAACLFGMSAILALGFLRGNGDDVVFAVPFAVSPAGATALRAPIDAASRIQIALLEQSMAEDRLYRLPGLSLGQLARHLAVPAPHLRFLIHQGLGYRNLTAFLNACRLTEVKRALADSARVQVPVGKIAAEAGFAAGTAFDKAFRAETGQDPDDYRQLALRKGGYGLGAAAQGTAAGGRAGRISG